MKKLLLIFLLAATCNAAIVYDRDIYEVIDRKYHRSILETLAFVSVGIAEGQLLYWDVSASRWAYADVTKLKWNDVTDILLVDTLNLNNALTVPYGGTGTTTLTDGGILLGSGVGAITALAVLADGEIIVGDGTTDPVAESGNTARTSLGLGIGDSPTWAGATITGNSIFGLNSSVFQPTTDSTTFFQILDADGGTPILNVDTTNERVGIGTAMPGAKLRIINPIGGGISFYISGGSGGDILRFWENGYAEMGVGPALTLAVTGDVGIRTTTPDSTFQVVGDTRLGADTTHYTEVNTRGAMEMHGDARVRRHIVIGAASWKKGATAPTDTYENIFPTISFNAGQDDEAHYAIWVPYRWDDTTDMEVHVHWQMPDDADNGNVFWKLKYIGVKEGEDPAGAGTEITQLSAGNHPQDEIIDTVFTTKMLAANLEREDDLGLMLWRHGTDGSDDCGEDAELIAMHIHFTMNQLGEPGLIPVTDVLLLDGGVDKLLLDDGASFLLIRL